MKMYCLYLFLLLIFAEHLSAQTKPTSTAPQKANAQAKPSFTNASDSLKFAINDFKSSMNNLFGSKKDTIALVISGVEYDDPNLEVLKDNLKKLKGAKFIGMQFKAAVAKIELAYKGKPTELWDELPVEIRKAFKIVEVTDNNLMLANRAEVKH
jgi:hypothetical protein